MRSIKTIKGFKNDKRNLLEATNNLIVFGEGQSSEQVENRARQRRRRRVGAGMTAGSSKSEFRSASRIRNSQPLVPGPGAAFKKLKSLAQYDVMSNYFLEPKPWNKMSRKSSAENSGENRSDNSNTYRSTTGSTAAAPPPDTSSSKSKLVEDAFVAAHVCPVCSKGFEPGAAKFIPASDIMRHSMTAYQQNSNVMFRKNLEEGWGAMAKPKFITKPQDVVVSANCGDLFHKICLRDWCSAGHKRSKRVPTCPSCMKELKYTMCQEIEVIRNFSSEPTTLERDLTQTKLVNKELLTLWPETSNYFIKLQNELKDAETLYKEIKAKKKKVKAALREVSAEDLSILMSKVTDPAALKAMLDKQAKALKFMGQETLQIMRMYLMTIMKKPTSSHSVDDADIDNANAVAIAYPSSESDQKTDRIPSLLRPYIQEILNSDQCLNLLSRIIVPMPGDGSDHKLKQLEMEILEKCKQSYCPLRRTSTYTVVPAVAGVTESIMNNPAEVKETIMEGSSVNFLRDVGARHHHQIPEKSLSDCFSEILRPITFSNPDFVERRPSPILDILEVANSDNEFIRINSSAGLLTETELELEVHEIKESKVIEVAEERVSSKEDKDMVLPGETDLDNTLANYPLPFKPKAINRLPLVNSSSLEVSAISLPSVRTDTVPKEESESEGDLEISKEDILKIVSAIGRTEKTEVISVSTEKVEKSEHPPPPRKTDKNANDDSWSTISTDEDLEESAGVAAAAPATTSLPANRNPSCELVFSAKENWKNDSRQVCTCHGQAPVPSEDSLPEQQVSIAIMYIVDDEGEESATECLASDTSVARRKAKGTIPPEKTLSPLHVQAEKASEYSLIADQNSYVSSSSDQVIEVAAPNEEEDTPSLSQALVIPYRPPSINTWFQKAPTTASVLKYCDEVSALSAQFQEQPQPQPSLNNFTIKTRIAYEKDAKIKTPAAKPVIGRSRPFK